VRRPRQSNLGCQRIRVEATAPVGGKSKLTTARSPTCQRSGAHHRKETPPESEISFDQALVQSTTPFLPKWTRVGMVVRPNHWNKEVPRDPDADSCGVAVQNGMASKYLIVSAAAAH
jgi:hypothetical protein